MIFDGSYEAALILLEMRNPGAAQELMIIQRIKVLRNHWIFHRRAQGMDVADAYNEFFSLVWNSAILLVPVQHGQRAYMGESIQGADLK